MNWNVFRENNAWSYRVFKRTFTAGEGWEQQLIQYETDFETSDAAKTAAKKWMVCRRDWV